VQTWWPKRGNCYNSWCASNKTILFFENKLTCTQWTIICVKGQRFCNAINSYKYCDIKKKNLFGPTHCWVTPLKNDFEEWLRNRKWSNCFPWLFPLNVFITISFFPHVYPLHALIYGLKFILEQKNEICF